jgi:hypothetical protein
MIGMKDMPVFNFNSQPNVQSRYREMVKLLRASLAEEKDCLYLVHTPIGTLEVISWNYVIPGFVAIRGVDEESKTRFLTFSEEAMCSFGLEVKRKKEESPKEPVGFKPKLLGKLEVKA